MVTTTKMAAANMLTLRDKKVRNEVHVMLKRMKGSGTSTVFSKSTFCLAICQQDINQSRMK